MVAVDKTALPEMWQAHMLMEHKQKSEEKNQSNNKIKTPKSTK